MDKALEDFYKTLSKSELLKLALESTTDETICIDNVEKLVQNVSADRDGGSTTSILSQLLAELEREERPRLARKGQMRRTGRNQ